MEFLQLEIQNFKTFAGHHVFDFTKFGSGLHFLTGQNFAEPELGSNGIGKSTLWDALYWTLYGKSLRGQKAGDCFTWFQTGSKQRLRLAEAGHAASRTERSSGSNRGLGGRRRSKLSTGQKRSCVCRLKIRLEDTVFEIHRSWRPNKLELISGSEVDTITQEQLEERIGLSGDSFQQSIVIGQFSKMFFDLRPAEKLSLFTSLVDLDYWLERSSVSSMQYDDLQRERSGYESRITSSKVRVKEIRKALERDREDRRDFVKKRKKKEAKLDKEIKKTTRRREKIEVKIEKLKKKRLAEKSQTSPTRNAVEALLTELERVKENRDFFSEEVTKNNTLLNSVEIQIKRLKNVKKVCPVCGQKVKKNHLASEKKRLIAERSKYRKACADATSELEGVHSAMDDLTVELNLEKKKLEADQVGVLDRERKLENLNAKLKDGQKHLKWLWSELESLKSEKGSYAKRISKHKERLKKIKSKVKVYEKKFDELENISQAVGFWVSGFKDVRLFVIEEILNTLSVEVNNYLGALGMSGWSVRFDIERETKSGNINRGFHVFVKSPMNKTDDLVPLEAWSGGEGQRLRIAATMGLANLILDQHGITSNIQVWDEPLYGLSGSGHDDALELLRDQARETGKQIWLVDHRSLEFDFDSTVYINKDRTGSHLVV